MDVALMVLLALIFIPAVWFLLLHGLTRPWWRTWASTALIASSTGWTLVAGGFLLDYWWGIPDVTWLVIAGVAALAAWLKLGLLIRARRASRDS